MKRLAAAALAALACLAASAEPVRASLLIMDPGGDYFSCTGHAALRMESDDAGVERCFSYESEPGGALLARFLAGGLRMGMFRVPTKMFLEPYVAEGRGVKEYRLNLPMDVRRELWKVLDERFAEGIELPYDYLKRGCAQATLRCITEAAERRGRKPVFPAERPYWGLTCRESFGRSIPECPWTFCFLHLVVGSEADAEVPRLSRIYVPADLLDLLKATTIDGQPVLTDEGAYLTPPGRPLKRGAFTPLHAALLLLLAAILAALPRPPRWLSRSPRLSVRFRRLTSATVLTVATAVGLVASYTVFCTSLPGTGWNWLIVPFNPLVALGWRWRRKWWIAYCAIVAIWIGYMLISPHSLTIPAYLLLAAATAVCAASNRAS